MLTTLALATVILTLLKLVGVIEVPWAELYTWIAIPAGFLGAIVAVPLGAAAMVKAIRHLLDRGE